MFRLNVNKRDSLVENDVITNETDLMHIILYCYSLQVAYQHCKFTEQLLFTSQIKCEFSTLTRLDCANLKALHFAFIFPLTARQHLSSSSSGSVGNFVKIKTEEKKDLIDQQTELLEGTLSLF